MVSSRAPGQWRALQELTCGMIYNSDTVGGQVIASHKESLPRTHETPRRRISSEDRPIVSEVWENLEVQTSTMSYT